MLLSAAMEVCEYEEIFLDILNPISEPVARANHVRLNRISTQRGLHARRQTNTYEREEVTFADPLSKRSYTHTERYYELLMNDAFSINEDKPLSCT